MKKKLKAVIGLGISSLFDQAMGLCAATALGSLLDHRVTWLEYIIVMFVSVTPDVDCLWQKITKGQVTGEHKNIMHDPLLTIPAVFLIAMGLSEGDPFWTLVVPLTWFLHYVHDSCERGPGIGWLWPFVNGMWRRPRLINGKWHFKMTPAEAEVERKVDVWEWVEREYQGITVNSVLGVVAFTEALIFVASARPPLW
jgi:hypothetical protein